MSLEALLLVLSIHAVALISPGPDFAVVTRLSIVSGRATGLWAAAGVAAAIGVYVLLCAFGLTLVLAALPGPTGVAVCGPVKHEADLRPLIADWIAAGDPGFMALLPVVVDAGRALAFRAWRPGEPLVADRYCIPTPTHGDFVAPQALLLPVNGFDSAGYRLGYGGGFFDRTLAALDPPPLAIGVGFELSRVDSIDPQPHDQRLDAMVTEAGVWRFG